MESYRDRTETQKQTQFVIVIRLLEQGSKPSNQKECSTESQGKKNHRAVQDQNQGDTGYGTLEARLTRNREQNKGQNTARQNKSKKGWAKSVVIQRVSQGFLYQSQASLNTGTGKKITIWHWS